MALGKILSTLARLFGWSPIGKSVLLSIDDSLDTTLNNCLFYGNLVTVNQDGTAIIELEIPLALKESTMSRVLTIPRHQYCNFFYLFWGFIAVDLINPNMVNGLATEQTGARFAVASLKIVKSTRNLVVGQFDF